MVEVAAHPQTHAPRISMLEQTVDWLKGKVPDAADLSDYDKTIWKATYLGANTNPLEGSPWATALIYGLSTASFHETVFDNAVSTQPATQYQDGKGLAGWLFRLNETRWTGTAGSGHTLSTDVFGEVAADFVSTLRGSGFHSLVESVWGSTANVTATSQSLADRLATLRTDMNTDNAAQDLELSTSMASIAGQIASINSQLDDIRTRLSHGGL